MTLLEALTFLVLSVGLVLVGWLLSGRFGTAGWLVGVVPVGAFWTWVLLGAINATVREFKYSLMSRPSCAQGNCTSKQYVLVRSSVGKALFRCRCGDLYVSEGDDFSRVMPDNSVKPYMRRDAAKDWKPVE